MMIRTRTGHLVLALAFAASVTACTPTAIPTAPAATATATPTPTPTPTPTTLSPAEQDLVNAKAAVTSLWAVVDRLTNDPTSSLQDLDAVASGEALDFYRKNLVGYRLEKLTGSGNSSVEVQSAWTTASTSDGLTTWTGTACVDASKSKLVDSTGKSVSAPPYRILHRSVVVQRAGVLQVDRDEVLGTC